MWICRECLRAPESCRCTPPIELVHRSRLRQLADLKAIHRERHTLTERDKRLLKSYGARWE